MWVTIACVSFAVQSNVIHRCSGTRSGLVRELFRRVTPNRISRTARSRGNSPRSQSHGSIGSQSTWKSKSRPAHPRASRSRSVTDQTNRPARARARHAKAINFPIYYPPKQPHKNRRVESDEERARGEEIAARRSGGKARVRERERDPRAFIARWETRIERL